MTDHHLCLLVRLHAYLAARLGPPFLGDLDGLQAFPRLDALRSQRRALLAPGPRHLGFPAAWLASSLAWRSAHHGGGVHGRTLHAPVCQRPEALRQHDCTSVEGGKKKEEMSKKKKS